MNEILFHIIDKPAPCPSRSNCRANKAPEPDDCLAASEREAGGNCCDFVDWIVKPISTFDAVEVVAECFSLDARTLEESAL